MFLSFQELFDIVLMTFAIGFIFSRLFQRRSRVITADYDPLVAYQRPSIWDEILQGAKIAAPAVVLHELNHKFVAMAFGAEATLHAPYVWYAIVLVLILINFPLFFFVGGYVTHTPLAAIPSALVAFAGPFMNLLLWALAEAAIRYNWIPEKHHADLKMMAKINLFLAGFNMIPLPGFDGWNVVTSLWSLW
ncbi:hypothetical protein HZB02_02980 [Candidatus Woesearchaeota archaeon]|nr:hypothetical protein [Candidatus Woesearchaeota archaeon]